MKIKNLFTYIDHLAVIVVQLDGDTRTKCRTLDLKQSRRFARSKKVRNGSMRRIWLRTADVDDTEEMMEAGVYVATHSGRLESESTTPDRVYRLLTEIKASCAATPVHNVITRQSLTYWSTRVLLPVLGESSTISSWKTSYNSTTCILLGFNDFSSLFSLDYNLSSNNGSFMYST